MERLHLFWIIHLTLLILFGMEMVFVLSIWLRGRIPGLPRTASPWCKLMVSGKYLLKLIFSHRLWQMTKTLVADGMIHRRILKVKRSRWFAHIAVFGSFLLLGLLSIVTGVAVEIFPNLFPPDHFFNTNPVSAMLRDVDHPLIAFFNDFFGLIILIGLILIIYRRYYRRDSQLRTVPANGIIVGLLTGIVATGFFLEAFRLLAHQPYEPTATWAFIGYPLARLLQPLNQQWDFWYNASFWLHFVITNMLLFYAPFSPFAHAAISPIIVTLNVVEETPA
jgi:nitrate reductase gamma subunit